MEKVTLGGDRLGNGKKMTVELGGFKRANFDLSYIWRSSMSAGTLVPFLVETMLPGDTIDIELNASVMTHPTVGPLFGSFKMQLDIFQVPYRLYNSWLHNNKLNLGRQMQNVILPKMIMTAPVAIGDANSWQQINQSCLLAYLGVRGIGNNMGTAGIYRKFNAVPLLAYWDIYKQYYANLQQEIGAYIHAYDESASNITSAKIIDGTTDPAIPNAGTPLNYMLTSGDKIQILTSTTVDPNSIWLYVDRGSYGGKVWLQVPNLFNNITVTPSAINGDYMVTPFTQTLLYYKASGVAGQIAVNTFPLSNIDNMRESILATSGNVEFTIDGKSVKPYNIVDEAINGNTWYRQYSQEGLAVKTYQSDLFNNWLNTTWINTVATQSAVNVLGGQFTIDELTIKKKIWDLLNRINVAGGSYDDWIGAVYDTDPYKRAESPMYIGGMSEEVVFQEVISLAQTTEQPLGTLGGRGKLSGKRKGGKIVAKADEHSVLMGIVSLTPRIDYSQGNSPSVWLNTMDDFHKPNLDQIGFQDLITEQMAYWDTVWNGTTWVQKAAGKQPAWINYQTNINKTYGSFAEKENEMFMTLNRRYSFDAVNNTIKDLTTYIDPSLYNYIFAETKIDAQNFWVQIAINMEARRKMSAKNIPNL